MCKELCIINFIITTIIIIVIIIIIIAIVVVIDIVIMLYLLCNGYYVVFICEVIRNCVLMKPLSLDLPRERRNVT